MGTIIQNQGIIAGVDIGSFKCCCSVGELDTDSGEVKLLGLGESSSTGIKKGSIVNRERVIDEIQTAIREAESMSNVKIDHANVTISGNHIRGLNTQGAIAIHSNGTSQILEPRSIQSQDISKVLDMARAISFPIDRKMTARLLGFSKPTINSIDSVSDRDFAIEFIFVLSLTGIHLSRLAEEVILWSSQHFNFVELPDELSTGSSMMPQKKNPDGAELVRANASSVISNLNNILSLLKGLPLAYSKDLQDDKRLTFNTYDNVLLGLQVMSELMKKIKFNKKTMLKAVDGSYATSTDLADWLVKKLHYPFRQAYQITGKIVDYANSKNTSLSNISLKELQKFDNNITSDIFRVLSPLNSMKSKNSLGGSAPETVKKSIQYVIKKYL